VLKKRNYGVRLPDGSQFFPGPMMRKKNKREQQEAAKLGLIMQALHDQAGLERPTTFSEIE
jgi:hypothetical protein